MFIRNFPHLLLWHLEIDLHLSFCNLVFLLYLMGRWTDSIDHALWLRWYDNIWHVMLDQWIAFSHMWEIIWLWWFKFVHTCETLHDVAIIIKGWFVYITWGFFSALNTFQGWLIWEFSLGLVVVRFLFGRLEFLDKIVFQFVRFSLEIIINLTITVNIQQIESKWENWH